MSNMVRGRWGVLSALASAAILVLAACGGSQTSREPGEDSDAQMLVERSPADEAAAKAALATAKPLPPPGMRSSDVPDGNLIDFEVLDFMPPDDVPDVKDGVK